MCVASNLELLLTHSPFLVAPVRLLLWRQVSRRREAEADRADSAMLREISRAPPGGERERLERAGKGLQMLTEIIERRRQSGFEVNTCTRYFSFFLAMVILVV